VLNTAGLEMDLSFLDKSSAVTPLLVKLYDGHKVYELAKDQKPIARTELTGAVVELLEMELSARESELIADVLIALMRQAEVDLRQAIADKLSVMENVPLRLVLQFANDDISVAGAVLRNSPILGDVDLLYIIKSKSTEYWREIASRQHLSDAVINTLADTRDIPTAVVLSENTDITLTNYAMDILAELALDEPLVAYPFLMREEITNEIASKLYRYVGEELKKYILEHHDLDQDQVIEAIDEIMVEFEDVIEDDDFIPSTSAMKAAERFESKDLLTTKLMLGTLKRGQLQSFIAQFAKFTDMDVQTVVEVLRQQSGQGLAVVCKAKDIIKADFISIFLLTNPMRGDSKVVDTNEMMRAIQYYERIDANMAKDIMKNSLGKLSS